MGLIEKNGNFANESEAAKPRGGQGLAQPTQPNKTHAFGLKPLLMLIKKQPFSIIIPLLLTALIIANTTVTVTEVVEVNSPAVKVSPDLQPQFDRLNNLLEAEGIKLDYSKLRAINTLPLAGTFQGIYDPTTHVLTIDYPYKVPMLVMVLTPKNQLKKVISDWQLVTLAHEIMHSQGVLHEDDNPESIMGSTDENFGRYINTIGAEEFILRTYRRLDSLKVSHPLTYEPETVVKPLLSDTNVD